MISTYDSGGFLAPRLVNVQLHPGEIVLTATQIRALAEGDDPTPPAEEHPC